MVQGFIFPFLLLKRISRQQIASQLVELRNRQGETFGTKKYRIKIARFEKLDIALVITKGLIKSFCRFSMNCKGWSEQAKNWNNGAPRLGRQMSVSEQTVISRLP